MSILRQVLNSLLGLVLLAWATFTYAYWWGIIDRDKYNVKGPMKSAFALFGIPLVCILLLGLLNRKKK